ncbi:MAG: flagellar basal body P-ring formation chaperone FlgA [Planctomycetota bacterium]|jgi:flagella basal body P-ring formation protein FlgA
MSRRKLSEILKTLVAAIFVIVLIAVYSDAEAGEIRLMTDADVSGPTLKIGDVAEVVGFDEAEKERISNTSLGAVPRQREIRTVTRKEIELRLQHRGMDTKDVIMSGAGKVDVRCGSSSASVDDSPIRRTVEQYLKGRFADRVRISILGVDLGAVEGRTGAIYPSSQGSITMSAEPEEVAGGGTMFVYIPVLSSKGEEARVVAEVLVTRLRTVVRAVRNISRGRKITESDLSVEDVAADSVVSQPLSREGILGAKCGRNIKVGEILCEGDVVSAPVIKKGDKVSVVIKRGVLEVTTIATALEDGAIGASIRVENPNSKRVYRVTVTGTGKARKD